MTSKKSSRRDIGAEADDVLDVALRERAVDESTDYAYDDHQEAEAAAPDESEDYVLYSEVKPHLEALVQLQHERAKMVELLLYARDRVSSPAVAARMDDNLTQLGIQVIAPEIGTRFDPQQHEASATVFTEDANLHGTIAEVELAGYLDGDQLVRHPIVTVYTTDRTRTT